MWQQGQHRRIAGGMFGADRQYRHRQPALGAELVLADRFRNRTVPGEAGTQCAWTAVGGDVGICSDGIATVRPAIEHEFQVGALAAADQRFGKIGHLVEHEMPEEDVVGRCGENARWRTACGWSLASA
ncbi:hypothetical protein G6F65_022423 [Rhizopus arrhizus]|nr:hypothetical protein G6F65_022423 [Rhizopus arrhizus]